MGFAINKLVNAIRQSNFICKSNKKCIEFIIRVRKTWYIECKLNINRF